MPISKLSRNDLVTSTWAQSILSISRCHICSLRHPGSPGRSLGAGRTEEGKNEFDTSLCLIVTPLPPSSFSLCLSDNGNPQPTPPCHQRTSFRSLFLSPHTPTLFSLPPSHFFPSFFLPSSHRSLSFSVHGLFPFPLSLCLSLSLSLSDRLSLVPLCAPLPGLGPISR